MRASVPCGECRLCCRSFMVPVRPEMGDDVASYQTAMCHTPGQLPYMILDRHNNGDCVHLGKRGCTIWDRAPYECRMFDCRNYFRSKTRNERRDLMRQDTAARPLFYRAKELLR